MKQASQVESCNRQEQAQAPVHAPQQGSFSASPLGQLAAAINSSPRMQALTQLKAAIQGSQRVQSMMRLAAQINANGPVQEQRVPGAGPEHEADELGAKIPSVQQVDAAAPVHSCLSPPGATGPVIQRMKLNIEKDRGKFFIVGEQRRRAKLMGYMDGQWYFDFGGPWSRPVNEEEVKERAPEETAAALGTAENEPRFEKTRRTARRGSAKLSADEDEKIYEREGPSKKSAAATSDTDESSASDSASDADEGEKIYVREVPSKKPAAATSDTDESSASDSASDADEGEKIYERKPPPRRKKKPPQKPRRGRSKSASAPSQEGRKDAGRSASIVGESESEAPPPAKEAPRKGRGHRRSLSGSTLESAGPGTAENRRFVSSFDITFEKKELQDDNPLDLHLELRKRIGAAKDRFSQNQVNAALSLILQATEGTQRVVRYNIPGTFTSGGNEKAITEVLMERKLIEKATEYKAELHSHSEQEMILHLKNKVTDLADELAAKAVETGENNNNNNNTGEEVVGIILDLVSIPNTVCNICHGSLQWLFSPQSRWVASFLEELAKRKVAISKTVQTIIRASAENVFKGAQTQYAETKEGKKFESNVNVANQGQGPVFLEYVADLEKISWQRKKLLDTIFGKSGNEQKLLDSSIQPGKKLKLDGRTGIREPVPELVGTKFLCQGESARRQFEVVSVEGGVTVRLLSESEPKGKRK